MLQMSPFQTIWWAFCKSNKKAGNITLFIWNILIQPERSMYLWLSCSKTKWHVSEFGTVKIHEYSTITKGKKKHIIESVSCMAETHTHFLSLNNSRKFASEFKWKEGTIWSVQCRERCCCYRCRQRHWSVVIITAFVTAHGESDKCQLTPNGCCCRRKATLQDIFENQSQVHLLHYRTCHG